MNKEVLKLAGLEEGEISIYLALLKLGPSTATKLGQYTGRHRTHIYDTLEKLKAKALVSSVKSGKVQLFSAAEPERIITYLEENKKIIQNVVPELKELQKGKEEEAKVEVLKGKEGLIALERDIIKTGKDLSCFGVEDKKFYDEIPIQFQQYLKQLKQSKIKERLIVSEEEKLFMGGKNTEYRAVPKKHFSPIATNVYGNKVSIVLWKPLLVISVDNKELADSYRKQFDFVWKNSKSIKTT